MPKTTWFNANGAYIKVKNIWGNVNGVWKQKVVPKGNINGVWKEFISYFPEKFFFIKERGTGNLGTGVELSEVNKDGNIVATNKLGLNFMLGFDIDKDGFIYSKNYSASTISDNRPVAKYTPDYTEIWYRTESNIYSESPTIAVDVDGYVYYRLGSQIFRITRNGEYPLDAVYGRGTKSDVLAVDGDGMTYAEESSSQIQKRDWSLTEGGIWAISNISNIYHVTVDDERNVYISSLLYLDKYDRNGTRLKRVSNSAYGINYMVIGKDHSVYAVSKDGIKLFKLNSSLALVWEIEDAAKTFQSVTVDPNNNIFTSGYTGYRKYDSNKNLIYNKQGTALNRNLIKSMPGSLGAFPNAW